MFSRLSRGGRMVDGAGHGVDASQGRPPRSEPARTHSAGHSKDQQRRQCGYEAGSPAPDVDDRRSLTCCAAATE